MSSADGAKEAQEQPRAPVQLADPRTYGDGITYRIGWAVCWLICTIPWPRRVCGRERVPKTGGVLLVANHSSFLDIPAVGGSVGRHVTFVARESLGRNRFLAWLIPRVGTILIRRGEADRGALRAIVERLEQGGAVLMFPEGTRTPDGRVHAFKGGAVYAAQRAGATIVPVGVNGTGKALGRSGAFRFGRIEVHIGEPLALEPGMDRAQAEAELRATVAQLAGLELA